MKPIKNSLECQYFGRFQVGLKVVPLKSRSYKSCVNENFPVKAGLNLQYYKAKPLKTFTRTLHRKLFIMIELS